MLGRVAVHKRQADTGCTYVRMYVRVQTTGAFFPGSQSFSFCRLKRVFPIGDRCLFRKFHETATKRFCAAGNFLRGWLRGVSNMCDTRWNIESRLIDDDDDDDP